MCEECEREAVPTTSIKVQFVHGKEGSPRGRKATLLGQHFELRAPGMNTDDFEASLQVQAEALTQFRPDVLVGSSFGGAVALQLIRRGLFRGPTLLLAPATLLYEQEHQLPGGVPVLLVHGADDRIVPIEHSRRIAATGAAGLVELRERPDGHPLNSLVESGELLQLVQELYELRARAGKDG